MAVESTFSQNLDSRNRRGTASKKKLRKMRSIKVSRGSYLRQSLKSSNSRLNWPSIDESNETSSLHQPSLVTLSDSSPNYRKITSSVNAKKECSEEGSEYDEMNLVVCSSCGSSDRVVCHTITMSDDAAMPRHQSSVESLDASPKSLKAIRYQASLHDSESSYDSSDHSKSSHYAPYKPIYSGRRSLQTLTRSSSTRAVKILLKKSSFKPKKIPMRYSQTPEDMNVERATCSSTIKDSRFPERVELEPGQTESERISFVKVCPYHHCSLNGHCHDPPPPKKPFLRRKSQSSIPQMRGKPSIGSRPGTKRSADKTKDAKKQPMTSNNGPRAQIFGGADATIVDLNSIQMVLNEPSYSEKDNEEILDRLRNSVTKEEGIPEANFELKHRTLECYKTRTEEDKSNTAAFGFVSEGHDTTTSFGENDNFFHTHSLKYSRMPHDQVSVSGDYDLDSKSSKNTPSFITRNLLPCKMDEAKEETNSNQKPTKALVSASNPAGDSEHKEQVPTGDSKPAVSSLSVHKPQLGKGRNMSMWHLIHKHMASSLAAEGGTKPLRGANEGRQMEEADTDTPRKSSDVTADFSDSDMGTYNQEEENQDIEIRKLYAIKLVREAIEKILLPEVQDQLSENQSVTSDVVEGQELSERNHQEGPDEGRRSENRNIIGSDNKPVDETVQVHESIKGQEIKKLEANQGKKSDKKSPSNWSNLKKWILLQRFTKELEKVRKLNHSKTRQLQLETDPEAEKISLRRQPVDEKRRGEEWMLDYALQQVVNQLAPTQKTKVALLVRAFETVVPPQEDRNIQAQDNVPSTSDDFKRSSVLAEHSEAINHHTPAVSEAQSSTDTCLKLDDNKISFSNDVPLNESERDSNGKELSCLKTEVSSGGSVSTSTIEKTNDLSGVAGEQSYSIQSEICDMKSIASGETLPASDEINADNSRASGIENNRKANEPLNRFQSAIPDKIQVTVITDSLVSSSLEQQEPTWKETNRESRPEPVVVEKFPPLDSVSNYKGNEAGQPQLDKQNYLNMWHTVCQHVVSSVASKVGIELPGEEDEEVEEAKKLSGIKTPGLCKDNPKRCHETIKGIHVASHHQVEFSRSQVLKLVKEAVQEILSQEIQDDSSDTLSVSSEIHPEKELSEKDESEGVKQRHLNSTGLAEQNTREFNRSEQGFSLDEEKESKNNASTTEDSKKVESLDKSKSDPPKQKNWSKLKKLILLKRSIKAMEKARMLKSQPLQQLPLPSNVEPEKVDLRHQMMDERRKAEQWMLDYAVQHIVTKLTPARKTRVAMLVEAFEAVVPLPET